MHAQHAQRVRIEAELASQKRTAKFAFVLLTVLAAAVIVAAFSSCSTRRLDNALGLGPAPTGSFFRR